MYLLWTIFATYFKIGLFSFGGGYGMVAMMQHEVVEVHAWLSMEQFTDAIAVSAVTPGALAVNSATFVGHRLAGLPGAIVGVFGVVLPSFLIMVGLATLFLKYKDHQTVKAVFQGIQPAIIALILAAAYKLGAGQHFTTGEYVIMLVAFVAIAFFKLHPIWLIVSAGAVGAMFFGR